MVQLERRYPEYDFEHFVQFQFHKGAIRTLARRYSFCFNSIMVQLEQLLHVICALANICFNSIKVQLEPGRDGDYIHHFEFQFHKGAIRTRPPFSLPAAI